MFVSVQVVLLYVAGSTDDCSVYCPVPYGTLVYDLGDLATS